MANTSGIGSGMSGTTPSGMGAGTSATTSGSVETDETRDLIASNKVEGTAVYNRQGERLGTVYNFMVDKRSGQVAYTVMSFGGFLGMGDSYHPLPWKALTYDTRQGGYVVDIDKERRGREPDLGPELQRADRPSLRRAVVLGSVSRTIGRHGSGAAAARARSRGRPEPSLHELRPRDR